jgi:hypothetical protein
MGAMVIMIYDVGDNVCRRGREVRHLAAYPQEQELDYVSISYVK